MSQNKSSEDPGAERPSAAALRAQGPLPLGPTDIEQDLYAPAAVDHFTDPRNVGSVSEPDGKGSDTNPSCGDRTTITVRIRDGRIEEARFRTFGCVAAIASASALTEIVTGRSVEAARELGPADVMAALGGLPMRKEACALMAVGALRAALVDAQVGSR